MHSVNYVVCCKHKVSGIQKPGKGYSYMKCDLQFSFKVQRGSIDKVGYGILTLLYLIK